VGGGGGGGGGGGVYGELIEGHGKQGVGLYVPFGFAPRPLPFLMCSVANKAGKPVIFLMCDSKGKEVAEEVELCVEQRQTKLTGNLWNTSSQRGDRLLVEHTIQIWTE